MTALSEVLGALETAEEFLDRFAVPYEQRVVDVHRLHILQRFHDRLAEVDLDGLDEARLHATVSFNHLESSISTLERSY